jgi:diguanylate cyclase (GGDEF)-like protein
MPVRLPLKRSPTDSGAPRLLSRFALYAGVALIAAAVAAFFFVRAYATEHAEDTAKDHAAYIASAVLPSQLGRVDFTRPVAGRRLARLDRLAYRELLRNGVLRVKLYNRAGTVVYSSQHDLIGDRADDDDVGEALAGAELSDVTDFDAEGGSAPEQTVLESYVPLTLRGARRPSGVFESYTDYTPIASEARRLFVPLAIGTAALLLALYLSLFPILRRVTRTMRSQVDEIEHKAFHDDLTGLPNRAQFQRRLQAALATAPPSGRLAVLIVDLDRFKDINDTLGHASGDRLLRSLAADLPAVMRSTDTVARLGGDEFGILASEIVDQTAVLALAEKLRTVLARPRTLDGIELEVDGSIGIAIYPDHGDDVETLVRRADVAMYRSKELKAPTLYDPEFDEYSSDRLELIGELQRAIAERELVVHYQPQFEPGARRLQSVEALVRWQHPRRGLLMPDRFIPLAEHTGVIHELTRYVISTALEQCRRWSEEGLELGVAVNVSPTDLLDPDFPRAVGEALEAAGVAPGRLVLEVTENSAISDMPRTRAAFERLHRLGVRLAIDDYGTGSTSLAHFRNLPIDALKIDRSFVMRMDESEVDAAIVGSTIALAHDLGLSVVAEGVESESSNARLAALGCDVVQGFLFGRALPAEPAAAPAVAGATSARTSATTARSVARRGRAGPDIDADPTPADVSGTMQAQGTAAGRRNEGHRCAAPSCPT